MASRYASPIGIGLSGFAQGFAQIFSQDVMNKAQEEAHFRETIIKDALDNPEGYTGEKGQKLLKDLTSEEHAAFIPLIGRFAKALGISSDEPTMSQQFAGIAQERGQQVASERAKAMTEPLAAGEQLKIPRPGGITETRGITPRGGGVPTTKMIPSGTTEQLKSLSVDPTTGQVVATDVVGSGPAPRIVPTTNVTIQQPGVAPPTPGESAGEESLGAIDRLRGSLATAKKAGALPSWVDSIVGKKPEGESLVADTEVTRKAYEAALREQGVSGDELKRASDGIDPRVTDATQVEKNLTRARTLIAGYLARRQKARGSVQPKRSTSSRAASGDSGSKPAASVTAGSPDYQMTPGGNQYRILP